MLIVRRVHESDLDPLFELIQKSEYGLTTLKISKDELESRIEKSLFAFTQKSSKPSGQPYVFVMEDLHNGKIVGTCSIYSKIGGFEPMYSYEIKESVHKSNDLDPPVDNTMQVLHLREEHNGPTEIGSLFLSPEYWGNGHGRLLSLSRFLFMADFGERFEKEIVAEMRGVVDKNGKSPLWTALGSHFFQIEFPKAETLTSQSKKFIADLMPKHPIYIPLLPEAAREVIGHVHENTQPALNVLVKEGFEYRGHVDIFDGGPTMHCQMSEIGAIKRSVSGTIGAIEKEVVGGHQQLVSNAKLDFKTCLGDTKWNNQEVVINQVTALRLGLKVGDKVRCVDLRGKAA